MNTIYNFGIILILTLGMAITTTSAVPVLSQQAQAFTEPGRVSEER